MPAALTFPGVYLQEVPSGVRTITGVATSITAFVGRAAAGPIDDPQMLTSYADYERQFGGLDVACPMSYAVRDFYLNGGALALVVRVAHEDASTAKITLTAGGGGSPSADLVLEASSAGAWGNRLSAAADHDTDRTLPRTSPPSVDEQRFDLAVRYRPRAGRDEFVLETFGAVSTDPGDPRFLPTVLERESAYVRVSAMPGLRPLSTVSQVGSTRTIDWVDADADSGSDGGPLQDEDVIGEQAPKTGIYALNRVDLFNLLCIPPLARDVATLPSDYTPASASIYQAALALCVERRAMLIVDPDPAWGLPVDRAVDNAIDGRNDLGLTGPAARNAALYFPAVRMVDPLRDSRVDTFVPSGIIAGVIARTDVQRGVWKAPAGLEATLNGVSALSVSLTDPENGELNPLGVNCLRSFPV
ncbi:MAG: phage tail sheath family protein, partial [Gammaproteobacteria bacterium]